MTIAQATGKRIQELIFKNNITQYRLSKDICIDLKTISNMINGKNKDVKSSTIFLICYYFNITISEFYNSPLFDKTKIDF